MVEGHVLLIDSPTEGGVGFLAFVTVRAAQGRPREVHPFMWIASAAFALALLLNLYRLLRGPDAPDRIIALDTA